MKRLPGTRSTAHALAAVLATLLLSPSAASAKEQLPSDSIYQLASKWTEQDGARIKLAQLAGRPRLVAMIYTSCRYTCPMTVAALRRIEQALPGKDRARVGVVLVSFDSARDTPANLARFAASQKLDPARYTLLHGDEASVRELSAALGFHFRKTQGGQFEHDSLIVLIDEHGVERHRTSDLQCDPADFVRALEK